MPGKIIYEAPLDHECEGKPDASLYGEGSKWQCDDCREVWIIEWSASVGNYWRRML